MLKGFSKGQSECHQLDTARECHRKMSELGKKIKEMNNNHFQFFPISFSFSFLHTMRGWGSFLHERPSQDLLSKGKGSLILCNI